MAQVGRYHLFILVTANPIMNSQIRVSEVKNMISPWMVFWFTCRNVQQVDKDDFFQMGGKHQLENFEKHVQWCKKHILQRFLGFLYVTWDKKTGMVVAYFYIGNRES